MHELYYLKEIAERLLYPSGFSFRTEEAHPDSFGSYYAIYSRSDVDIRFVWDGKDGWGLLECRGQGEEDWQQIGSPVPEGALDSMQQSALKEWKTGLEKIL